jgi:hypothetical protein
VPPSWAVSEVGWQPSAIRKVTTRRAEESKAAVLCIEPQYQRDNETPLDDRTTYQAKGGRGGCDVGVVTGRASGGRSPHTRPAEVIQGIGRTP